MENNIEKTPKEQADELLYQYSDIVRDIDVIWHYELSKWSLAKACAINACKLAKQERERAMEIAYSFKEEQKQSYESKKKAGNELAFVSRKISEECRYVGNAISGHNALSITLNEKDYWDKVIEEIEKQ